MSDDEGIEPGVIRLDVGLRDGEVDAQKDQQGAQAHRHQRERGGLGARVEADDEDVHGAHH